LAKVTEHRDSSAAWRVCGSDCEHRLNLLWKTA